MKKIYPYILPAIALLIVIFLAYRWYSQRTERKSDISQFGDNVEVEELSEEEKQQIVEGTQDMNTVQLNTEKEDVFGEVRYDIKDDKVLVNVNANLPELNQGSYQVWFTNMESDEDKTKAFKLEYSKAGYIGNGSVSSLVLPFKVIVSQEYTDDNNIEEVIFTGEIIQPEDTQE